jgi:hypothetical protein
VEGEDHAAFDTCFPMHGNAVRPSLRRGSHGPQWGRGISRRPLWADGKLYYAEYGGNRVNVWNGTAHQVLWKEDGCGPSAVMPFAGGVMAVDDTQNAPYKGKVYAIANP